jgi:hypothetical protein
LKSSTAFKKEFFGKEIKNNTRWSGGRSCPGEREVERV